MFASTHGHHLAWEIVKWMALIALAGAIALSLANQVHGQQPRLLPEEIEELAQPMFEPPEATAIDVWLAIQHHEYGDPELALEVWQAVQLRGELDVWRHVAVSAAMLQMGDIESANAHLDYALEMAPDNAAAHYFRGVASLTRAEQVRHWMDHYAGSDVPYIGSATRTVGNVLVHWHGNQAIVSLEEAAAGANRIPYLAHLTPMDLGDDSTGSMMPVVPPTVGDLLTALGAEQLGGRSHHVLGDLYLQRGSLDRSEGHLDSAVDEGVRVVYVYEDLGRAYEERGEYGDAARAYLKASTQGLGVVGPGSKAFHNLWKAATGH